MNVRIAVVSISFCFAAASFANAEQKQNGTAKPEGSLFSKKLADGSTLVLEKETSQRTVTPRKGRPPGSPPGSRYEAAVLITDRYQLTKGTDKAKEVVWEKVLTNIKGFLSGWGPEFVFWDAEVVGGKVYVLYSEKCYAQVDVVAKESGKWTTVKSERLKDRERCVRVGRFFRDSGGLGIRYVDEYEREEKWDIRDDVVTPSKEQDRRK